MKTRRRSMMRPTDPTRIRRLAARTDPMDGVEERREPNTGLGGTLTVVLLIHIVAVCGIFAFTLMKKREVATPAEGGAQTQPAAGEAPVPERARQIHYVRQGETLSGIARQYMVTVAELATENGIRENVQLQPGQDLRIPQKTVAPGAPLDAQGVAATSRMEARAPAEGRGADGIALPPIEAVTSGAAGKPAPAADGRAKGKSETPEPAPKAGAGETSKPASKGTATMAEQPATPAARGDDEALKREFLTRRDGAAGAARAGSTGARPATEAAPGAPGTYIVQKGDNPVTIAKRFGVDYQTLLKVNKISDPRRLQIGQKLVLPPPKERAEGGATRNP